MNEENQIAVVNTVPQVGIMLFNTGTNNMRVVNFTPTIINGEPIIKVGDVVSKLNDLGVNLNSFGVTVIETGFSLNTNTQVGLDAALPIVWENGVAALSPHSDESYSPFSITLAAAPSKVSAGTDIALQLLSLAFTNYCRSLGNEGSDIFEVLSEDTVEELTNFLNYVEISTASSSNSLRNKLANALSGPKAQVVPEDTNPLAGW